MKKQSGVKKSAQKRTLNRGSQPTKVGEGFNQQDPQRRLGNFTTAGEHSRVGSRTAGIIGQTKQKNRTDKKSSR